MATTTVAGAIQRYDELIALAAKETDGAKRFDQFREAETILVRDEMPICPLFYYVVIMFYSERLGGIAYSNLVDGASIPHDALEETVMERIVIRSSNWLGDAVMSVPAVRAIKQIDGAHVTVLTPEKLAAVWRLVPEVDEVIPFPAPSGKGLMRTLKGMTHVFRVAKLIRGRGFTTRQSFSPTACGPGLEMWLARIPRRVGYAGHARRSALLTDVLREKKNEPATAPGRHQVFHYLRLAEFLGASVEPEASSGFVKTGEAHPRAASGPAQIAVCAGAEYGPAKRWLPERFAEVVQNHE